MSQPRLWIVRNRQKANFRSLKYPHNKYSHPNSMELTRIHCCLVISIEKRRQKLVATPSTWFTCQCRYSFVDQMISLVRKNRVFHVRNGWKMCFGDVKEGMLIRAAAKWRVISGIFPPCNGFNHNMDYNMAWNAQIICFFLFFFMLQTRPELNVFSKNASIYAYTFFFLLDVRFSSPFNHNANRFLSLKEKWEFFFFHVWVMNIFQ